MDFDQSPRWGELPDDEGDELLQPNSHKTSKTNFLGRWMAKEAGLLAETEESDKDSKKKRRFRKLFSSLFPSIAETESPKASEEETKHSFFADLLPEDTPGPDNEKTETVLHIDHRHEVDEVQAHQGIDPEFTGEDQSLPETDQRQAYEYQEALSVPEVPPPFFATRPPEIRQESVAANLESPQVAQSRQNLVEQAAITPARTELPPTERRHGAGAVVALVAAEYLNRRQGRKLKKAIKKLEQENQQQRIKAEGLQARVDAVETQAGQQSVLAPETVVQQAESVSKNDSLAEFQPSLPAENRDNNRSEYINTVAEQQRLDKIMVPEKDQKPEVGTVEEVINTNLNINEFLKKREKHLNEIKKSPATAEVNKPDDDKRSEKDFDRRHEILEEPTMASLPSQLSPKGSVMTPASSIGEVLRAKHSQLSKSSSRSENGFAHDGVQTARMPAMYQQSMQYGVTTALVVIAAGLIIYRIF